MAERAESQQGPLVGRYALHGEIAAGGMATVHFGRFMGPAGFRRVVAIKRLHPQLALDPDFVSMFFDEVRLAARIQHPNVVATMDAVDQDGELFLIMEYVHGEALSRLLRLARAQGQPVPVRFAATILCDVLHGLHAAHEATGESGGPLGIVHRDVSPQNVMVGRDGVARVLDFGIAKAAGRMQTTREGQVKGKMAYLAPENVYGGPIDRRSDIYGAAVVLWEAVTGVRLFEGDNDAIVLAKVLAGEVPPLALFVDKVPAGLQEIVSRGVQRDPEHRFATAREMALALHERVGVASPSELGDWVGYLARDALSVRSQYIAALEQVATARSTNLPSEPSSTRRLQIQSARPSAPPESEAQLVPAAIVDVPHGGEQRVSEPAPVRPVAGRPLVTTLLLGSIAHEAAMPGQETSAGPAVGHSASPNELPPSTVLAPPAAAAESAPVDWAAVKSHDQRLLSASPVAADTRSSVHPRRHVSTTIALTTALFLLLGIVGLGWSRASRSRALALSAAAVSVNDQAVASSAPLLAPAPQVDEPARELPAAPSPAFALAASPIAARDAASFPTPTARSSPPSAVVPSSSPGLRSAASAGRAACHPPYVIDGNGIKHFKLECL